MEHRIKLNQYSFDIDVILVYCFFVLTLVLYLFQHSTIITILQFGILALGALRGYVVCVKQKFVFPMGLAIFFTACWLLCFFVRSLFQPTHSTSMGIFAYTLCYIGMSVLLLKKSYGLWGSGILLLICGGIIIFKYIQGIDPQDIVINASRNFISVLMLFFILLYYLALYQSEKRGPILVLLPVAVYFGICIVAYGRGGILTSGFLLGFLFVYEFLNMRTKQVRKWLRLFILIVVALIVLYYILSHQISLTIGNFSSGIISVSRINIWSAFFKNNVNSFIDFLCGSDVLLIRSDANTHNAFLQSYAVYGLIAFCGLVVLSIKAIMDGIRHKDFFWTILVLTLFLRAFTDKLFYTGYCELFLYYFLMYWRYKKIVEKN